MRTREQVLAELAPLQDELGEIEDLERRRQSEAELGKCYRYRNNYGSDCPGWWLYKKVIGVDEYSRPVTFQFEQTSREIIEIKYKEHGWHNSSWEEITPTEFEAAWRGLKRKVAELTP